MIGYVTLVGAGPGDPELITMKGLKALRQADIVIYDRLVNTELLKFVPPWSERIYAGKGPHRHRLSQGAINKLLVQQARMGKKVVRLKGGDPFVFGRGGEECQALAEAGISYEVVPGISSALGVPGYAGIPVTHRHMAQSFTVITGHSCEESDPLGTDWEDLPRKGTLIILMGVRHLPQIAERLIADGRSPDIPAATIYQGTYPLQEVVEGTLGTIADLASHIRPPAITVVGEVVALRQQIDWFASLKPQVAGV